MKSWVSEDVLVGYVRSSEMFKCLSYIL